MYVIELFVFTLRLFKIKIQKIMNELIAKIKELNAALVADAELQVAKGHFICKRLYHFARTLWYNLFCFFIIWFTVSSQ